MSISSQILKLNNELPSAVKLVAVSKFKPLEAVLEAYGAGQRIFGENRPQELAAKAADPRTPADVEWHMIGHLQTNKVKMVVPCVSMIQSIDSVKLLNAVNECASSFGRVVDCLLEVHIASEESKQGFLEEEIVDLVPHFGEYGSVRFRGVMGMASFVDDKEVVRTEFRNLKRISEKVRSLLPETARNDFDQISMGMSHDWPIAVEEGATMVRIGTDIFGARY
jgi:pyridoxal phosphate enzyme, YggS family